MASVNDMKRYTFDLLLGEASRQVTKEKRRVYCDILISYPGVFDSLPKIMDYYSDRKRSHWTANISPCGEEDFYLVSFYPKEDMVSEKPAFFFWKILRDDKYVTILSFSLQNFAEIRRSLDSLVRFAKGLWFAWVGSSFLESFDLLVQKALGEDAQILASFQTAIEKDKIQHRKVRAWPLPPRQFVPLESIRTYARERYVKDEKIQTFSNMRYRVVSSRSGVDFTFSVTSHARITFERGDFTLFVMLLKPLVAETRRILDFLRRNSYSTKTESTVLGKRTEITSLDLIEALVFKKPKGTEEWYNKIVGLFSSDIPQEKLVNFTLLSGNPYFLVHIVDVGNGSAVYLSATSEELQIVPAEAHSKEVTVAKIIELLQNRVDPSISLH
jgi:hypothetical protein